MEVAAWVQAIGSILAILVAVAVPAWQRWKALHDAQIDRTRQEREHLQRLTAGLRAEIKAALDTADRQNSSIERTMKSLQDARAKGAIVRDDRPIQPGSMVVTDAIIYRKIASELGRFPPDIIKSVVQFYALSLELGRVADATPTAQQAYEIIQGNASRLKMQAALLIKTLEKFEASAFAVNADICPTREEIKELAAHTGYPLDQVASERGIHL